MNDCIWDKDELWCEACTMTHDNRGKGMDDAPWISIKDRLPKNTLENVLCYGSIIFQYEEKETGIYLCEYELDLDIETGLLIPTFSIIHYKAKDEEYMIPLKDVTHWMPLPEQPKDKE